MKTIAIFLLSTISLATFAVEQDTTQVDLGKSGLVTIVDKGSTNVITIETDSISDIVGAVAADVLKTMSQVMRDMFETLAITAKEIEEMQPTKNFLNDEVDMESLNQDQRRAVEEMKEELNRAQLEIHEQRQELRLEQKKIQKDYQEQVKKYEQYQAFSKIYSENKEELRSSNGKVTIEVDEPVLNSPSYYVDEKADTTEIKVIGKSILKVVEGKNNTELSIGGYSNIQLSEGNGDTVIIRLGNKVLRVVDGEDVQFDNIEDVEIEEEYSKDYRDYDNDKNKNKKQSKSSKAKKFKGHWGFFELGRNMYTTPDYSSYTNPDNFMELNYNKSYEVNINPIQFNVGLLGNKRKGTARLGLVSGIGFSWNNYVFDKNITVEKKDNMFMPKVLTDIEYPDIKKSKLTATYLTVPLMLEFQFPGNNKMHFSAGGIGAVKLEAHTKIKFDGNKEKDKGNFYMAPYRYGVTARFGYGNLNVYGTYYFSEMIESTHGPKNMLPYTIGIGFAN